MSDVQMAVLGLLIFVNLFLALIAWGIVIVNRSIRDLRGTTIANAITTQDLMREHTSELQRARLRAR